MKRTCICLLLFMGIAITGCASIDSLKPTPLPTTLPTPMPTPMSTHLQPPLIVNVDTIGLLEVFTKHEELRALFEQVASGSMSLAGKMRAWNFYNYYYDGTNGYYTYEKGIPDASVLVDKKTADAISQLEELSPVGMQIEMREFKGGKKGRMCVFFTHTTYKTGKDAGYYEDRLFYSSEDFSDLKQNGAYTDIGGGWWFASAPMPY